MKRKFFSLAIAVAMLLTLIPGVALAAGPYDIASGNITVVVDENGKQTVNGTEDDSPEITGTSTGNTVSIVVADGRAANVTFKDLSITTARNGSGENNPVVITKSGTAGTGTAVITVEGTNTITHTHTAIKSEIGITIKGIGTLNANAVLDNASMYYSRSVTCIDVKKDLTIQESVIVNVNASKKSETTTENYAYSLAGVQALGNITVEGNAALNIDADIADLPSNHQNQVSITGITAGKKVVIKEEAKVELDLEADTTGTAAANQSIIKAMGGTSIEVTDNAGVKADIKNKTAKEAKTYGMAANTLNIGGNAQIDIISQTESSNSSESNSASGIVNSMGLNNRANATISDNASLSIKQTNSNNVGTVGMSLKELNVSGEATVEVEAAGKDAAAIKTNSYNKYGVAATTEELEALKQGSVTIAPAPEPEPDPEPAPSTAKSNVPGVSYECGNTFKMETSKAPTAVLVDGVSVPFSADGKTLYVNVSGGNHWMTVEWMSTTYTFNFTCNDACQIVEVAIPKTGDMPLWAAIAAVFGF